MYEPLPDDEDDDRLVNVVPVNTLSEMTAVVTDTIFGELLEDKAQKEQNNYVPSSKSGNWVEAGLDSIRAAVAISTLANKLHMSRDLLTPSLLFEYPTPQLLAQHLFNLKNNLNNHSSSNSNNTTDLDKEAEAMRQNVRTKKASGTCSAQ